MSGATSRSEYFLESGRLVKRRRERPSGRGRWSGKKKLQSNLVALIEVGPEGIEVTEGPASTPELVAECVMTEHGMPPGDAVADGVEFALPQELLHEVQQRFRDVARRVSEKYPRFASENRMTGALFDRLEEVGSICQGGWEVSFQAYNYSEQVKEGKVGADVGIVVDIKDGAGRRLYKAMLVQAKRSVVVPDDVCKLQGVAEQRRLMQRYSDEEYVWVYTPACVAVYEPGERRRNLEPDIVLMEALACKRGDRSKIAVGSALDSKFVLRLEGIQTRS